MSCLLLRVPEKDWSILRLLLETFAYFTIKFQLKIHKKVRLAPLQKKHKQQQIQARKAEAQQIKALK
jgi:hypothetical protein